MMGEQFVAGRTIAEALRHAAPLEAKGFTYSYDMLGEAAVTAEDVRRVARQYLSAENRTVVITQPQAAGPVKGAQ